MRVEKKNKAFAYRVPIGDYNYLQCTTKVKEVTDNSNLDLIFYCSHNTLWLPENKVSI